MLIGRINTVRVLVTMTALLILGLAACSSGGPAPTCTPSGTQLHIAVENGNFNTKCLAAPASQAFTIEFENQDTLRSHNIHILDGGTLFVGEIARHGTSITYEVGPLKAGTFQFRCDIHPSMNGTFIVK